MEGLMSNRNDTGADSSVAAVFKRPHVILRFISLVFCVIVVSCVSTDAWEKDTCQFNGDTGACNYGMAVGMLSGMTLVVFVVIDFVFDRITDAQLKKMIVFADIVFFGLWSFLWFVAFCYLADSWRKTLKTDVFHGENGMRTTIAFSFFSILTSTSLSTVAYIRHRQGASEDFMAGYDPSSLADGGAGSLSTSQSAYTSLPSGNAYGDNGGVQQQQQQQQKTSNRDAHDSDAKPLIDDKTSTTYQQKGRMVACLPLTSDCPGSIRGVYKREWNFPCD